MKPLSNGTYAKPRGSAKGSTKAWGKHTAGDSANASAWGHKSKTHGAGGKGGNCTSAGSVLKGGKKGY